MRYQLRIPNHKNHHSVWPVRRARSAGRADRRCAPSLKLVWSSFSIRSLAPLYFYQSIRSFLFPPATCLYGSASHLPNTLNTLNKLFTAYFLNPADSNWLPYATTSTPLNCEIGLSPLEHTHRSSSDLRSLHFTNFDSQTVSKDVASAEYKGNRLERNALHSI